MRSGPLRFESLLGILLITLAACAPSAHVILPGGSAQNTSKTPEASAQSAPSPSPSPTLNLSVPNTAALWADIQGSGAWTNAVLSVVRTRITDLEKAADVNDFCPGYATAIEQEKTVCWVRLMSAVAKFESDFNPSDIFHEPDGSLSIGLLSLSKGECKNAPTNADLEDPVANLICGTNKMADLIAERGRITGTASDDYQDGASAYWSTLRPPYKVDHMDVGDRPAVIALTQNYQKY